MEEQVVSRAHRMGQTRPVLVETLAMRGTIEEQMLEYLQDPVDRRKGQLQDGHNLGGRSSQRSSHDPAESSYLAHLDFVRTAKKMVD
jgi:SNF2 family DNA or RNA helicase